MKSLSLAQPHALIMVGISGSGKSHFAKKFASTFGSPLVQAEAIAPNASDNEAATRIIRTFVDEIVKTKQSFIIDAGGSTKRDRAEFSKYLHESGYVPLFVWIQTDTETARQRSKRKNISDDNFERAVKKFTPLHSSENAVVLSGKHTYATQARVVLKRLSAPRAVFLRIANHQFDKERLSFSRSNMPTFEDKDFGTVTVRRSSLSKSIRVSVAPNGTLRISMPALTPIFMARRMLVNSREEILALINQSHPQVIYYDGMKIGKSHYLKLGTGSDLSGVLSGQMIRVTMPDPTYVETKPVQRLIHDFILKALRIEAKRYLPRRLAFLADKYGFSYQNVRFSHASSRWGSCSSNGTISLNIALMSQEHELIDYVLIHELCHTVEMNHSDRFWNLVEACDSDYRTHRQAMKKLNPHVL